MPQNSVVAIVQTRDGYIWLGTFGGLARFDGVKFTIFNTANTPALKSSRITTLYEDQSGVLWIGAETGDIARYENGAFTAFDVPDSGATNMVEAMLVDREGALWVADSHGVIRYLHADASVSVRYDASSGLPDSHVRSICEDTNGNVWLAGLFHLARVRGNEIKLFTDANGLPDNRLNKILRARNGGVWVVTRTAVGLLKDERFYKTVDRVKDEVAFLAGDESGSIWYGDRNSLYKLSEESNQPQQYEALSSMTTRSSLVDREGNLWVGTLGDGLIRWKKRQVSTITRADGLLADDINSIVEDSSGAIWIAGLGLARWKDGHITDQIQEPEFIGIFYALQIDHNGVLWAGGSFGLASVVGGKLEIHRAKLTEREIEVKSLFEDSKGQLWVGRRGGGLQEYRDGKFITYTRKDGLVNDDVRFITEDRAGALWIGTVGGLSRLKDGAFTNYTTLEGLSNNFVRAVFEDNDTLWIGTYGGGISRFRNGKFSTVTSREGLFDDVVSRILPDRHDNFWILGNRGIFMVSRNSLNEVADGKIRTLTCGSYGVADGMISSEGNGGSTPAGWITRDGRMWFPTIRGVVIIDPEQINRQPPSVTIEQALSDRQPLDMRAPLVLYPGRDDLEIHYTGLSFAKPEQVNFRYKLEGLDDDWLDVGQRRVAYFTRLPPGHYTFRVMAANAEGIWSEQSASLSITIVPPFWRRWWFVALAIVTVCGMVALGFGIRLRQLKKAQLGQEDFSRRLLSAHESERSRLAGELHDGLGQDLLIIKNWAQLGLTQMSEREPAREQLEEISSTASHALEEARSIARNLRPFQLERFGLTAALQYMIRQVENSSGIAITARIQTIDHLFPPDAEISLYRIVQESLNNIVKHSGATEATVHITCYIQSVHFFISDNGHGVRPDHDADTVPKIGFGLTGIAERVRLLGGRYSIQSLPGQGLSINITIAVRSAVQ